MVKFEEINSEFKPNFGEVYNAHTPGKDGASAYEVAVKNGFIGSETEWLESLRGAQGIPGKDGAIPTKGVDYYTEEDKQGFISEVLDSLKSTMKAAKIGTVTLLAEEWVGANSLYSQVVTIEGVTENSQVDITPSVEQLVIFYEKDISFVTENEGGLVTVYAIGQKPTNDYVLQVTITEVDT